MVNGDDDQSVTSVDTLAPGIGPEDAQPEANNANAQQDKDELSMKTMLTGPQKSDELSMNTFLTAPPKQPQDDGELSMVTMNTLLLNQQEKPPTAIAEDQDQEDYSAKAKEAVRNNADSESETEPN